ncbi:hypothetical protein BGZ74_005082 [Mortierella antarctica]|nr:hypothetical protein BGZ74_005082 [Mortierella antarctica]
MQRLDRYQSDREYDDVDDDDSSSLEFEEETIKILTLDAGQEMARRRKKNRSPTQQSTSIAHIESDLPPFHGHGANVVKYVKKPEKVEEQLSEFYN